MRLEIRQGSGSGQSAEASGERFVIGRDESADLVLDDGEVSREHAFLKELPGGKAELRDMGSRNGTYVNGERISGPVVLEGGEEIKLGDTVLAAVGPKGAGGETKLGSSPLGGAGETRLGSSSPTLALTIRSGSSSGKQVQASGERFVIGRDESADLVLDDGEVSREHAFLKELPGGKAELRDMGSRNGTYVNGERISGPVVLEGGEEIKLGDTVLAAVGPKGAGGETKFAASPSSVTKRKRPSTAIIAAAAAGGVVLLVAVLAIAGVFSGDSGGPLPAQEVAESLRPSTLQVIARDEQNEIVGGGSAWVYDAEKGLLVTNAHVVNEGSRFQAGLDGEVLRRANVVGVAPCQDIAVLRLTSLRGLEKLEWASSSDVQQGSTVYAVGFPADSTTAFDFTKTDYAFTAGTISALDTKVREGFGQAAAFGEVPNDNGTIALSDITQTDAAINPGNSGGPLVNDRAQLVGMNTVGPGGEGIQGQGGAISLETLDEVVPRLADEESIGWAGFGVAAVPSEFTEEGILPEGMYVTSVVEDTPADQTRLPLAGTVIVAINQLPVNTQQAYCNEAEGLSGQDVQLHVFEPESGEVFKIPITFP